MNAEKSDFDSYIYILFLDPLCVSFEIFSVNYTKYATKKSYLSTRSDNFVQLPSS